MFGADVIKQEGQGYTTDADGNNNVWAIDAAKMEETEAPNLFLVTGGGLAVAASLIAVTAALPTNEAAFVYNKAEKSENIEKSVVWKDLDEVKNFDEKSLSITDMYEAPAAAIADIADVAVEQGNLDGSATADLDQAMPADVSASTELAVG